MFSVRPILRRKAPAGGWGIYDGPQGMRLLVMNLIGRCDMKYGPDNPFLCADRILKENEGMYDVALAEIHANATSEKLAMGYYLDGRAAAVWGTHTHVQTADERVNPQGHWLYHGYRHDRPDRVRARRARGAVYRHVSR